MKILRAASRPSLRAGTRALRAFTLIELLVAAGVTALIAGFIAAIVANVGGFWSRNTGRLSAEAQARHILDQLTLDLQGALYRDDGATWLAASVLANISNSGGLWDTRGATTSLLKPATAAGTTLAYDSVGGIATDTFGQTGVWLRFFTTKRGSNTSLDTLSAPVAVGWQIIRRASSSNPASTDRRYFLHRAEVRPGKISATSTNGTLETGFDITTRAYITANTSAAVGDPAEIKSPTLASAIGENVIDFGVRFYTREATTGNLIPIFPTTRTDVTHLANSPAGIGPPVNQFPEVIDVMVRILSDEGGRLIADLEAGKLGTTPPNGVSAAAWWWQLALAHSQVFTRRIVLVAQPL
ncbi:MAG TPA: hypothetical protein VHD62_04855 [Opitutaceae bacterium]|nr:hypothetical protein [Opitutaceae bacterium]